MCSRCELFMNLNFFASQSGILFAAAGLVVGIVTSALAPANAVLAESLIQPGSSELTAQPSNALMVKKDDGKDEKDEKDEKDDEDIKSLPKSCSEAVFKDASEKSGVPASQLRIVKVEQQTWSDGCLGLVGGEQSCSQSLVPGWRVIVASSKQQWVYRTNQVGSVVKMDEVATRTLASNTTTQITRQQQEVTTTRTTQTTQSASGITGSQSTQSMTGISGSQNTQSMTGVSSSQNRTTQSTQAAGSTQINQGLNTQTQQQARVTRSTTRVNFSDVSESHWAKSYITELAGRGILTGFPDGKFRPNEPVTRAQFAALVASVFNKTKVRSSMSFTDVSSYYWAADGIQEAYEMGFLGAAFGNQFKPYESLTRLQVVTALAKGLNYSVNSSTEKVLQFYSDSTAIPAEYRSLVAAATERGIVVNYPNVNNCSPNKVATRAEVAAILYQAMVSNGDAMAITSPYVAGGTAVRAIDAGQTDQTGRSKPTRQHCNQGIGNGAEGCDPGNSHPHGGSNDEGGRTPGNRPAK